MLVCGSVRQKWSHQNLLYPLMLLLQAIGTYIIACSIRHDRYLFQYPWSNLNALLFTLWQPWHSACMTSYQPHGVSCSNYVWCKTITRCDVISWYNTLFISEFNRQGKLFKTFLSKSLKMRFRITSFVMASYSYPSVILIIFMMIEDVTLLPTNTHFPSEYLH